MWFTMRPVEMGFLETAPKRWVIEREVAAPIADVWRLYTDATTWSRWFPGVAWARYRGEPPYGVGTVREAMVRKHRFEETMLAWEDRRIWAYRIDRCGAPLADAQLESTEFSSTSNGDTRLRWVIACDPGLRILRVGAPFFERVAGKLFDEALRNLQGCLTR
jgi:carbon monoxide dehydrogenase subunit G